MLPDINLEIFAKILQDHFGGEIKLTASGVILVGVEHVDDDLAAKLIKQYRDKYVLKRWWFRFVAKINYPKVDLY